MRIFRSPARPHCLTNISNQKMMEQPMKKPRKSAKKPRATAGRSRAKKIEAAIFAKTAAAAPKGCCTVSQPGAADRDIPGLTKAECNAIEGAHPGSVTHWIQGSCA
jgi:hypothetical protein